MKWKLAFDPSFALRGLIVALPLQKFVASPQFLSCCSTGSLSPMGLGLPAICWRLIRLILSCSRSRLPSRRSCDGVAVARVVPIPAVDCLGLGSSLEPGFNAACPCSVDLESRSRVWSRASHWLTQRVSPRSGAWTAACPVPRYSGKRLRADRVLGSAYCSRSCCFMAFRYSAYRRETPAV